MLGEKLKININYIIKTTKGVQMLLKKISKNKTDFFIGIIIVLIILFGIMRAIEFPGLYYDSVNPDYLAVHLLFPNDNTGANFSYYGFPLLGQLYHGTVTMFTSILGIFITGETSVALLRITNAIMGAAACLFLYIILRKKSCYYFIAGATVIALGISTNMNSILRTQFYVKIPGTVCLFISLYFLYRAFEQKDDETKLKKLLLSGILLGISFYSYFIYIFFVPAFIILIFSIKRQGDTSIFNSYWWWFFGFCAGAALYVLGYFESFIFQTKLDTKIIHNCILGFFVILLIFISVPICMLYCYNYKNRKIILKRLYYIYTVITGLSGILLLLNAELIKKVLESTLTTLNIAGYDASIMERFILLIQYIKNIFSNAPNEYLMFGKQISKLSNYSLLLFCAITLIAFFISLFRRSEQKDLYRTFYGALLLLGSYYICSFFFITRMGTQHFVPVLFVSTLVLGLALQIIYNNAVINRKEGRAKKILILVFSITIFVNIMNQGLLVAELKASGGRGKCSNQINELAYSALKNQKEGKREYYIFPEWGFKTGFNYLTMNRILQSDNVSKEIIKTKVDEGYDVIICFWDSQDIETYTNNFVEASIQETALKTWYTLDGQPAFYSVMSREGK